MTCITYQTKSPSHLTEFCEAMGILFAQVERHLYKALQRGERLNDLKRDYQVIYGINARQFNSIHSSIKGKIESRKQCHQRKIAELADRVKGLEKALNTLGRQLKKTRLACGIEKKKSPRWLLKQQIHQKKRKLATLQARLAGVKASKPSIIFGSKQLWKAQFNLEANGYTSHQEWLVDWRAARTSQFILVGSKDEKAGCQNCQLSEDGRIKIRVPKALESQFGQYVMGSQIKFSYGQKNINYALLTGQSLTYRFVRKNSQWYIFCTTDRPDVPTQSRWLNGVMGIDLNPGLIGWAIADREGNLKAKGQIRVNLQDLSSEQTKATLGDAVKQLVDIASEYGCPIAVETLDFSKKKTSMKQQGVRYSRMLSNFAYSKFFEMLNSRAERTGIEVVLLNAAYSSLIGLGKFMAQYGLSSDTAAGFVLARRALRKSERIPANLARLLPEDRTRHSWSYWNALNKKLCGLRRHDFFNLSAANRGVVVTLPDELDSSSRSGGKPKSTSTGGRDSHPLADNTARSVPDSLQLCRDLSGF